jgi:hypothetical protein
MAPLNAHVRNGQVVLDKPTALPEGAELEVRVVRSANDTDTREERDQRAVALINAGVDDELRDGVIDALDYQADW